MLLIVRTVHELADLVVVDKAQSGSKENLEALRISGAIFNEESDRDPGCEHNIVTNNTDNDEADDDIIGLGNGDSIGLADCWTTRDGRSWPTSW